jgi:hypothetical protein
VTQKVFIAVAVIGLLLSSLHRVFAQNGLGDVLQGTYVFQTSGEALLTDASDCKASGTVPAGLTDGFIHLDGQGNITGGAVGITLGVNNCTFSNYSLTGKYAIQKHGDGIVQAAGNVTTTVQGKLPNCTGTMLVKQPFNLVGKTKGKVTEALTIETYGAGDGSTYTESPPPGPISCTATVTNFVTRAPPTGLSDH